MSTGKNKAETEELLARDLTHASAKERMEVILRLLQIVSDRYTDGWAEMFLGMLRIEDASMEPNDASVTFRIHTEKFMSNRMGAVHGGCVVSLMDNSSTWALFCDPRYWQVAPGEKIDTNQVMRRVFSEIGVSRNLNTTYLRPVPIDADVLLHCHVESNSTRYAHMRYEISDPTTGKLLIVGSHDKAKGPSKSNL
ncbi:hypothetical protein TRVA0_023S01948 [Trichomonascus vanleenenianus]|uniref:PaaI family thioesterase n=1 Tax=Trichomonascus vanleenenianus TaxID=2268995 RepID=UPI003ECB5894